MFMMSKIKASRNAGKSFYHQHLSANDYYSEHEKVEGIWKGRLAKYFGVNDQVVTSETFSAFQQNINPRTGDKLTRRTNIGGNRFYDFSVRLKKVFQLWLW